MRYEILAPVPFFGFLVTYVVNSFLFCPGCSHHHENAELCGCFPRSVFSHKRYKSWRKSENILGWPLISIVSVCPTLAVLHLQENSGAIVFFFSLTLRLDLLSCSCFLSRVPPEKDLLSRKRGVFSEKMKKK